MDCWELFRSNKESCEYFCFSLLFSWRAKTHYHQSETCGTNVSPLQAETFLSLTEVYLMDFRNCPCDMWMWTKALASGLKIIIIDHHTKFVNVHPIHSKLADEVLNEVQKYCVTYRYPKKIFTEVNLKTRKWKHFVALIRSIFSQPGLRRFKG